MTEEHHHHLDPEIAREHEAINTTLQKLDDTTDPQALRPLLEELGALLEGHFKREEAKDGLHASISRTAVNLLPDLKGLFKEHREMSRTLDRLLEKSDRLSRLASELEDGTRELIQKLRDHEAHENQLFVDALYDVHGAGD